MTDFIPTNTLTCLGAGFTKSLVRPDSFSPETDGEPLFNLQGGHVQTRNNEFKRIEGGIFSMFSLPTYDGGAVPQEVPATFSFKTIKQLREKFNKLEKLSYDADELRASINSAVDELCKVVKEADDILLSLEQEVEEERLAS